MLFSGTWGKMIHEKKLEAKNLMVLSLKQHQEKKTIPTFCIGAPGQTNSSIVYSFIIYIS
jgi:hypothetical protein